MDDVQSKARGRGTVVTLSSCAAVELAAVCALWCDNGPRWGAKTSCT